MLSYYLSLTFTFCLSTFAFLLRLAARTEIGRWLFHSGAAIGDARHDEKQIRKPIQITHRSLTDLLLLRERHHSSFSSPRHRPRQMQKCSRLISARQDEFLERLKL